MAELQEKWKFFKKKKIKRRRKKSSKTGNRTKSQSTVRLVR